MSDKPSYLLEMVRAQDKPAPKPIPTKVRPGYNYTKLTLNRKAQVSAITRTHAVLYWPDHNTQTYVNLGRFGRTTEWKRTP